VVAVQFVPDSPLEGDGFEPSVPGTKEPIFVAEGELRDRTGVAKKGCFLCGTDGSNEFLASRFDGRPAIGDRTRFGAVELIVQGDTITQVGVELDPAPKHPWRSWLRILYWRLG
jgi:hypothetical protein